MRLDLAGQEKSEENECFKRTPGTVMPSQGSKTEDRIIDWSAVAEYQPRENTASHCGYSTRIASLASTIWFACIRIPQPQKRSIGHPVPRRHPCPAALNFILVMPQVDKESTKSCIVTPARTSSRTTLSASGPETVAASSWLTIILAWSRGTVSRAGHRGYSGRSTNGCRLKRRTRVSHCIEAQYWQSQDLILSVGRDTAQGLKGDLLLSLVT